MHVESRSPDFFVLLAYQFSSFQSMPLLLLPECRFLSLFESRMTMCLPFWGLEINGATAMGQFDSHVPFNRLFISVASRPVTTGA